jgi:hypothetical protein
MLLGGKVVFNSVVYFGGLGGAGVSREAHCGRDLRVVSEGEEREAMSACFDHRGMEHGMRTSITKLPY